MLRLIIANNVKAKEDVVNLLNVRYKDAEHELMKMRSEEQEIIRKIKELQCKHQLNKEVSEDEILKTSSNIRNLEELLMQTKISTNKTKEERKAKEIKKQEIEREIEQTIKEKNAFNELNKEKKQQLSNFFIETIKPLECVSNEFKL